MKSVLVTGGTGFVGANLVRQLLLQGHRVQLLLRPGYDDWRLADLRPHLEYIEVLLDDAPAVERAVKVAEPDWIFHLAVYGAYSSQGELQEMLQTNVHGTLNLVNAALKRGFEAFVNTGSSSEYGYKPSPAREDTFLEPNSHYAFTKAAATLFCRFTAQSRDANISTLRLYSVYGPYESPGRLVPALVMQGLRGELPPLVSPETSRDFVYVDDAVNAYIALASCQHVPQGSVFNVGTGRQLSMAEVVEIVRARFHIAREPDWGTMESRSWDTSVWVADIGAIQSTLDWTPQFDFAAGFGATVEWFEANAPLWPRYGR